LRYLLLHFDVSVLSPTHSITPDDRDLREIASSYGEPQSNLLLIQLSNPNDPDPDDEEDEEDNLK